MALVDARGRGDVLKELDAGELELGLGEGQRDVDVHRLAVGALVALVAQAAELGDTALDGAGVLDVARGLAEAVGRAGHAGRARLVREGARQALEAEVALRVGLVLGDYSPAGTRCRWRTRAARRCLGCTARRRCR